MNSSIFESSAATLIQARHVRGLGLLGTVLLVGVGCESDTKIDRINEAPVASVLGPLPGAIYRLGGLDIRLEGKVSDEFSTAGELSASWVLPDGSEVAVSPDAEGLVSLDLPVSGLNLGIYEATLRVFDPDGLGAEDKAGWEVQGPLGAPTVEIVSPYDGVVYPSGSSVTFQGVASDSTTPSDELAFSWSSSIAGSLSVELSSDGRSMLVAEGLADGEHLVTLSVVDTDGETGSASIRVIIGEEGVDTGEVIVEPEEPEPAEEGDLVFSEMMVNPEAVDDEIGEWIEMYNTSGNWIDLDGYTFHDDDIDFWDLAPLVVGPGEYVVLCADMNPTRNGGVPCDGWFYREWSGLGVALANGEDELVLTRPDGIEIDWLHYDDSWFTPGYATGVDPDFLELGANNDGRNWCNQLSALSGMRETGSPGVENQQCME